MSTILVRKFVNNAKEVMLQKRSYGFLWRDWRLLDSRLYAKEQELADCCDQIRKLLNERKEILDWLTAEKKEISDSKKYRLGVSEPYELNRKDTEKLFPKMLPAGPVDGRWREVLNPKLLGEKKKPSNLREEMGIPDYKKPNQTAYIPEQLSDYKLAIEFGEEMDVMPFREPKQQQSSKSARKKRPGESQEDHQARLNRMDNGEESSEY